MGIIAKPLGYLLMWIYGLIGNYGVSLIVLTAIVKICLYPLYIKQVKSTAGMQNISEKSQEIQRKYADDKVKQQQALQDLYQQENFNPMAGCLPMLIQFPIIMGLFALLRNPMQYMPNGMFAAHEPFLWINDLAQPDRWILPIAAGAATFFAFSMTQNLTGADMGQAKSMNMIMKYFFTLSILWLARSYPAGLALYWACGQFIQIFLNLHMNTVRKKIQEEQEHKKLVERAEKELIKKKRARMKGNQ